MPANHPFSLLSDILEGDTRGSEDPKEFALQLWWTAWNKGVRGAAGDRVLQELQKRLASLEDSLQRYYDEQGTPVKDRPSQIGYELRQQISKVAKEEGDFARIFAWIPGNNERALAMYLLAVEQQFECYTPYTFHHLTASIGLKAVTEYALELASRKSLSLPAGDSPSSELEKRLYSDLTHRLQAQVAVMAGDYRAAVSALAEAPPLCDEALKLIETAPEADKTGLKEIVLNAAEQYGPLLLAAELSYELGNKKKAQFLAELCVVDALKYDNLLGHALQVATKFGLPGRQELVDITLQRFAQLMNKDPVLTFADIDQAYRDSQAPELLPLLEKACLAAGMPFKM